MKLAHMPKTEPEFALNLSRGLPEWLARQNASLAFTTYQIGRLFLLGTQADGKFWIFNRKIGRCLGMAANETGLWVSADVQFVRYENALVGDALGPQGCDKYYAPRVGYFTGDIDAHDVGISNEGKPVFINTLFNCLATVSDKYSFEPIWRPPFISRLAAEDRCHLNGLAMVDGEPKYVTAGSQSDVFDGWREHRQAGGVVIDIETNEIVCAGLSMPHSPRWHDGKLWLHNSGTGEFGFVDFDKGSFEAVTFCPGYLRGTSFLNNHAVVGLSKPRNNKTFTGLPLDDALVDRGVSARCGIYFIDLTTGSIAHSITMEGIITELYEVCVLPDTRQPGMLGPQSEELKTTISLP